MEPIVGDWSVDQPGSRDSRRHISSAKFSFYGSFDSLQNFIRLWRHGLPDSVFLSSLNNTKRLILSSFFFSTVVYHSFARSDRILDVLLTRFHQLGDSNYVLRNLVGVCRCCQHRHRSYHGCNVTCLANDQVSDILSLRNSVCISVRLDCILTNFLILLANALTIPKYESIVTPTN